MKTIDDSEGKMERPSFCIPSMCICVRHNLVSYNRCMRHSVALNRMAIYKHALNPWLELIGVTWLKERPENSL